MNRFFLVLALFYGCFVVFYQEAGCLVTDEKQCQSADCVNGSWVFTNCQLRHLNGIYNISRENKTCSSFKTGCRENTYYLHQYNIRAYYRCVDGRLHLQSCSKNKVFDPTRKSCIAEPNRLEKGESHKDMFHKEGTKPGEKCKYGEKRQKEGTCRQYYECINGTEVTRRCSQCEHYNAEEERCRYVFNTPRYTTHSPGTETTLTSYGKRDDTFSITTATDVFSNPEEVDYSTREHLPSSDASPVSDESSTGGPSVVSEYTTSDLSDYHHISQGAPTSELEPTTEQVITTFQSTLTSRDISSHGQSSPQVSHGPRHNIHVSSATEESGDIFSTQTSIISSEMMYPSSIAVYSTEQNEFTHDFAESNYTVQPPVVRNKGAYSVEDTKATDDATSPTPTSESSVTNTMSSAYTEVPTIGKFSTQPDNSGNPTVEDNNDKMNSLFTNAARSFTFSTQTSDGNSSKNATPNLAGASTGSDPPTDTNEFIIENSTIFSTHSVTPTLTPPDVKRTNDFNHTNEDVCSTFSTETYYGSTTLVSSAYSSSETFFPPHLIEVSGGVMSSPPAHSKLSTEVTGETTPTADLLEAITSTGLSDYSLFTMSRSVTMSPNIQYAKIYNEYTTTDNEYTTTDNEYTTTDNEYKTAEKEYTTTDKEYTPIENKSTTDNEYITTDNEYITTKNELTATDNEYTATDNEYTPTENEYTTTDNEYITTKNELTATDNEYTTSDNEYTLTDREYTTTDKEFEYTTTEKKYEYTTTDNEDTTTNKEQTTTENEYTTIDNEYTTTDNEYTPTENESTTDNEYTTTDNENTTTNKEQTTTDNEYTSNDDEYTTTDNEYTSTDNEYTTTKNEYTTTVNEYTTTNKEQTTTNNEYTTTDNEYTPTEDESTTDNEYTTTSSIPSISSDLTSIKTDEPSSSTSIQEHSSSTERTVVTTQKPITKSDSTEFSTMPIPHSTAVPLWECSSTEEGERKPLTDCKMYLECVDGLYVTKKCGWLQHFDADSLKCIYLGYRCLKNDNVNE